MIQHDLEAAHARIDGIVRRLCQRKLSGVGPVARRPCQDPNNYFEHTVHELFRRLEELHKMLSPPKRKCKRCQNSPPKSS